MNRITSVLAAIICIGAGLYLLSKNSAHVDLGGQSSGGQSWFEVIAHGMGIYFIGKGIFVGSNLWRQEDELVQLRRLGEFAAWDHVNEPEEAQTAP